MGFLTAAFFRDCTLFLQRRIRRKKMDDAFIQSLQITQGREERCSSLPWVCFSFFMLLFLFHEVFSPNGGFPTAEKNPPWENGSPAGQIFLCGTNPGLGDGGVSHGTKTVFLRTSAPGPIWGEWTSKKCPSSQR